MFEYCNCSESSFNTTIGNFLSHKVKWITEENTIVSVDTVNSWDRKEIATRYLYEYFCPTKYDPNLNSIGGPSNKELFIEEVAIKIDEFIPRRYFLKYNKMNQSNNSSSKNNEDNTFLGKDKHEITKGLIFKYKENESKKPFNFNPNTVPATEKQVSYLIHLAREGGYTVINLDSLSLAKAKELISFLLGQCDEPLDMLTYLNYV